MRTLTFTKKQVFVTMILLFALAFFTVTTFAQDPNPSTNTTTVAITGTVTWVDGSIIGLDAYTVDTSLVLFADAVEPGQQVTVEGILLDNGLLFAVDIQPHIDIASAIASGTFAEVAITPFTFSPDITPFMIDALNNTGTVVVAERIVNDVQWDIKTTLTTLQRINPTAHLYQYINNIGTWFDLYGVNWKHLSAALQ